MKWFRIRSLKEKFLCGVFTLLIAANVFVRYYDNYVLHFHGIDMSVTTGLPEPQRSFVIHDLREWVLGAEDDVRQSGDAEAAKVLSFVERHGSLCIGKAVASSNSDQDTVSFTSADDVDPQQIRIFIGPAPSEISDPDTAQNASLLGAGKSVGGEYIYKLHMIFLPQDKAIARRVKGIILIHEAKHAWNYFYQSRFDANDEVGLLKDEESAFLLGARVLVKMGGQSMDSLVEREVERRHICSNPGTTQEASQQNPFDMDGITNACTQVLGAPLSESDRALRVRLVAIYAHKVFYDQFASPRDKELLYLHLDREMIGSE